MRVLGNSEPTQVIVEPYLCGIGMAEVRLRENAKQVTIMDTTMGQSVQMWQYDEYVIIVSDYPGLQAEIAQNLPDWLATGKALETNTQSSVVQSQNDHIAEYEKALSDIETAAAPTTPFYAAPGASISDRANAVVANIQDMKAALALLDVQPEVT